MPTKPQGSPYSIHWPTKAGYSFASVGLSAIELMLQVFLLELYILVGLSPSMAGLAIAIAVIWDAVSDPLMGILSDKTPRLKSRGSAFLISSLGQRLSVSPFTFSSVLRLSPGQAPSSPIS